METSLHRALKQHYAGDAGRLEVALENYRIDVVRDDVLIEIQHASLGSIRSKVQQLLQQHRVHVVKPIIARKRLVRLQRREGKVCSRRMSPKRGCLLDLFADLVYFTPVFPHPHLLLEFVLVEVEEVRYPRRRTARRWLRSDYQVQDQQLLAVRDGVQLVCAADLWQFLPDQLNEPFDTQQLATQLAVPRWQAQQIAYCCRQCGAFESIGKRGNSRLYRRAA